MPSQHNKLSDERIEKIRATYVMTGSVREAAEAGGCAPSTAHKYIHTIDQWQEQRDAKVQTTIEQIIEECGRAQIKLIEALACDAKIKDAKFQEIATAFGIITDKRQLLSGQVTDRVENLNATIDPAARLTPQEVEQATKLRERLFADIDS